MDTPPITVPNIQKEQSQMVHLNFVGCSDVSSSSKRKKVVLKSDCGDFDSLPDDALNEILVRIPARDIFDSTMLVCRKWHHMTRTHNFVFAHLHHSTHGLLISNPHNRATYFLSLARSGEIEVSKFRYKFRNRVWSSCNGLVLQPKLDDYYEVVIANPSTNQHFPLPPFIAPTTYPNSRSTLAYVSSKTEYKVVRMYYEGSWIPDSREYCAVLTLGVDDSWRLIDTRHLSPEDSKLLNLCPLVTGGGGFVHWATDSTYNFVVRESRIVTHETSMINHSVLTLNANTEVITRIPAPRCEGGYYYYKYLSGGSYLSLLIGRGNLKWEVWEMKPETGEWSKLPEIDLEAHKGLLNESYDVEETGLKPGEGDCLDCKLVPAGWLKYRDVIVFITYRPIQGNLFRQARLQAVYDVPTRKLSLFSLDYHCHPFIEHQNSLVWMLD